MHEFFYDAIRMKMDLVNMGTSCWAKMSILSLRLCFDTCDNLLSLFSGYSTDISNKYICLQVLVFHVIYDACLTVFVPADFFKI